MGLPHHVEIVEIPDDKGGGFMAYYPQFGVDAIGGGETLVEAIMNAQDSLRALFRAYISEGIEIPEPDRYFSKNI